MAGRGDTEAQAEKVALRTIEEALAGLSPEAQRRILLTAQVFFGAPRKRGRRKRLARV